MAWSGAEVEIFVKPISFKRHRFPAEVIQQAVWLCFRFTLSIRDVEELLVQRGIEVIRETVRCWAIKFGPLIGELAPPAAIATDKLTSYGVAVRELGLKGAHRPGGPQANNKAENSHLIRRRERKQ